jgi:hypothetical protein
MANIVFSVVTLCSVISGRCFEVHVPHPEHTIATCESMMQRDAPIAVQSYNESAAPENRVSLGGFRCQEELDRPTYTIRR